MSKTRYVILGLLSEGSLTGYEIKKIIDIRFSFFWNESYGQLYPELKRLTDEGLVTAESGESRGQKHYSLTPQGLNNLHAWLREPVETESVRYEILLKMYFSGQVDSKVMQEHIRTFLLTHQKRLTILNAFAHELSTLPDSHEEILRVIDFGQKAYTAYVDWCVETLNYLKERENT